MKRTATLLLLAAILTPTPAHATPAAGPLVCGKWRIAADKHSVSRLCTSGPGTRYAAVAGCCGAGGCESSVFSEWMRYGNRALVKFGPYCYFTEGSAQIYTA